MGWSLRESTPGRKGAGSPPIPPPRLWCRAHGDMENHWRTVIVLKQAGSLLASCLSAFIHSLPSSLLHPFKITHCSHTGTTTCFWYPGKVITCQEKNRRAKPLQADLLNAQRAFSSREISQGRGQVLTGASHGPTIHITGNLAAAEFLGTWALWSSCPWGHVCGACF